MLQLGIDEAGRGSALGPLVVCGFAMEERDLDSLARVPVADSKELEPAERLRIVGELREIACRFRLARFAPAAVDRAVRKKGLNALEMSGMVALIRRFRPSVVYIDALTNRPARFGRQVEGMLAPLRVKVVAENRADAKYPLVQAASIIAKVTRDAAVARLEKRYGCVGSGYPSDLRTRLFLKRWAEKGDYPPCVRRSWSLIGRLTPGAGGKS